MKSVSAEALPERAAAGTISDGARGRRSGKRGEFGRSELSSALRSCRYAFVGIGLFSGVLNILALTGSFFMLEIYDRVVPSRSLPTLVGISILALLLYAFQGVLDAVRGRVLVRIAGAVDEAVSARVFSTSITAALRFPASKGQQPLRELDRIRSFMATAGPAALFDLPWIPLYLAICFLFHPLIGLAATIGSCILVAITLMTELWTREPTQEAAVMGERRNVLSGACQRNAEAIVAMGMVQRLGALWDDANRRYVAAQRRAADVSGGLGSLSRILRIMLQSGVLALGAYLVINQEATGGIIIASSILTSRALAPVEQAIAHWRSFIAARQSWRRLSALLERIPEDPPRTELPRPSQTLTLEAVTIAPPGTMRVVVHEVALQLKAGQGLGIVGPSASGKSSLARAMVGVWPLARGRIRLDGGALGQWSAEALGPHVGYLPQDVELFAGTVAQNIARFDAERDSEAVIAAAKAAGIDEMVRGLPDGYDTQIGDGGEALSAGQCQRVGLARALFGEPFLVVLDEPNSNLDQEGENALTRAILGVRARGGIVVVIAHRPSGLAGVDMVLMMRGGRQQAFGPKDTVLRAPPSPAAAPSATPAQGTWPQLIVRPQEAR